MNNEYLKSRALSSAFFRLYVSDIYRGQNSKKEYNFPIEIYRAPTISIIMHMVTPQFHVTSTDGTDIITIFIFYPNAMGTCVIRNMRTRITGSFTWSTYTRIGLVRCFPTCNRRSDGTYSVNLIFGGGCSIGSRTHHTTRRSHSGYRSFRITAIHRACI